MLGWIWLSVFAFFNTVPLFAISILANLNAVRRAYRYTLVVNLRYVTLDLALCALSGQSR